MVADEHDADERPGAGGPAAGSDRSVGGAGANQRSSSPDDALGEAIRRAAEVVGAATVGIGAQWGRGSGVVVAPGRVLTNAHNVGTDEVRVAFADGRAEDGVVAASDLDAELAVVDVDTGDVEPARPASRPLALGDLVVAVANPGGRGIHVTAGHVSALGRRFRGPRRRRLAGAVEHTAPLVRGSSGGPLLDRRGRWVGLNTHRLDGGLYLALPVDDHLLGAIDELSRGRAPARPRLGIAVAPVEVARRLREAVGLDPRDGLLVRDVDPDGPAGRGGVQRGDLVVEVEGEAVTDPDALHARLGRHDVGERVTLSVVRGADDLALEISLDR